MLRPGRLRRGIDSYYDDLTYDTNELRISSDAGWVRSFGAGKRTSFVSLSFALAVAPEGGAFYSSSAAVPFDGINPTNTAVFTDEGKLAWASVDTPLNGTFLGSGNLLMIGALNAPHDFGGGPVSGASYFVERDGAGNHVASWGLDVTFGSQFGLVGATRPRLRATPSFRSRKYVHISGFTNRVGSVFARILPQRLATSLVAAQYRKALKAHGGAG